MPKIYQTQELIQQTKEFMKQTKKLIQQTEKNQVKSYGHDLVIKAFKYFFLNPSLYNINLLCKNYKSGGYKEEIDLQEFIKTFIELITNINLFLEELNDEEWKEDEDFIKSKNKRRE